jgi:hypothetical protein
VTAVVGEEAPGPLRVLLTAGADAGGEVDAGDAAQESERPAARAAVAQWLARNAEAAAKHVDRFCEDSKKLAGTHQLTDPPRTRDAATYLGVRVDWEDGRTGLLHLPDALQQHVRELAPNTWPTALTPSDWRGLDFQWMQALLSYDAWSLSVDGPLHNQDSIDFLTAPIPNFIQLQTWAKLRLAMALTSTHDLPQASLEIRHLGDLIASTGSTVGEHIRIVLLRFVRLAWEASGQTSPEPVLSADDEQAARRVSFASPYFLFPGVPRAVREKALACAPVKCSLLMEALGAHTALRDFVPDAQEGIDWVLAQHPCDPGLAAKAATGKALDPETIMKMWGSSPGAERIVPDGGV